MAGTKIRLERWHHGESNDLECYGAGTGSSCGFERSGVSDHKALTEGRQHVRETGHSVQQARTIFRFILPI